ncbi:hypothetical protein EDD11_002018 [Mortierella claussenii]|nr:hypothetical protein EDD11_002018 [Mortierella claussenii]
MTAPPGGGADTLTSVTVEQMPLECDHNRSYTHGDESNSTHAHVNSTTHNNTNNNNNNSSNNNNNINNRPNHTPVSHNGDTTTPTYVRRAAGLSSFLGRLKPFSSAKCDAEKSLDDDSVEKDLSEVVVDTPGTQSIFRSKNNLTGDLASHPRYPLPHHHLRNDMIPQKHTVQNARTHHSQHTPRKSGVPGKNGQEPETDLFNFVNIMLNMPETPTWRQVVIKLAKVLAVMAISYFSLMALYFGAEVRLLRASWVLLVFGSETRTKNFSVMVVDLDQGMIGVNYVNFVQQLNTEPGQLNWVVQPATKFPDMATIQKQVMSGTYWGAVVIQPNASSTLNRAFTGPLPDYDPTKAFMFIYDGGRDPLVVKPHIVATMYTQFLVFTKTFNPLWIKFLLELSENKNISVTGLKVAPQVMGTPVAFEELDLHPLTASIITSATTVAYIWIFLVAGGSTYLVAHVIQPMTRNASVGRTMGYLLGPLLIFLSTLSMAYSVLLLTFGVPFPNGAPQFLSLFGGMLLLQCAVAAMVLFLIHLIPVVYIPSFTITFVILNMIAVFNPVELMPKFYRWVYAMPFLNAVQVARFVLMGSFNRLQYNLAVLGTWILIPLVLLPVAILRQKRIAREVEEQEEMEELKHQLVEHKRQLHYSQPQGKEEEDEAEDIYLVEGTLRRQVVTDEQEWLGREQSRVVKNTAVANRSVRALRRVKDDENYNIPRVESGHATSQYDDVDDDDEFYVMDESNPRHHQVDAAS